MPAFLAVGVFVWWAAAEGGFASTHLYPGTAVIFGALLVLLLGRPGRLGTAPTLVRLSLGLAVLFGVVALLATFWADSPGDAWDGGNRTLVYVACFALFALSPLRPESAAALLAVFATGIAAVGASTLARAAAGTDLDRIFVDGRLSQPVGYVNATCALFLMAFWPAVVLASRRRVPIAARALLLGVAFVLLGLALLAQSRASLVAVPLTALVAFAVVPGRVRLLLTLVPIAAVAGLTHGPFLAVYDAFGAGEGREAATDALLALGIGFLATVLAGGGLAWADRRATVAPALARRANLAFAATAVTVFLVGAAIVATANPVTRAEDAWDEFSAGYPDTFQGSHFAGGGLGDYRADYWQVAVDQFLDAPLVGVGVDNFAAAYVEHGEFGNEARFPHSTPLAIASSTGLVGAALFLGFLGCALAAFLRARSRGPEVAGVAGAALLVFAYWLVHGSVDWFWELPGLAAPAFAFLGVAAGLSRRTQVAGRTGTGDYLVAIAIVAALAAATPAWLAAREAQAATVDWREQPDAALDRLRRASRLNPLSERADVLSGAIGNRAGRPRRARAALQRAVSRNSVNWYAYFELAVAQARLGRREEALAALDRAAELNPREELIRRVRAWVADGAPIDLGEIDEVFRERVASRTGMESP